MATVRIVDYGAGNLASVKRAVWRAGGDADIATSPEDLADAERIILPGVGAAGTAAARLRERGWCEALDDHVRRRGKPMLGICLGLQFLAVPPESLQFLLTGPGKLLVARDVGADALGALLHQLFRSTS